MKPPPTAPLRRSTLRRLLIEQLNVGEEIEDVCHRCVVMASAELAGRGCKKANLERLLWAYPMFRPQTCSYDPTRVEFDSTGDDVFAYAGGTFDKVTVAIGRHASIAAYTIGRRDYWVCDGEIWYSDPAHLANRVRRIKEFVEQNAFFTDDRMHWLNGVPKATQKELRRWERKVFGPMPKGWAGPRRTAEELLSEPGDGTGEFR